MAKKTNPYAFTPIVLDQDNHEKRRIIKQLPAVHQTETLQKFFGASADHLFDPGKGKPINGYVGQKPLWYDPDQDYYLEEGTSDRTFYQLEAGMVSKTPEGQLTDLLPYPDLINQLRFQGALTNNHNRLFSQGYYTWCPPIDLDKIVNFRQYVWLPVDDVEPTSTFDDGANGWVLNDGNPAPVTGSAVGMNNFLGRFTGTPTGEQVVSKNFALNGNVTTTNIQFDFLKLNSWDAIPGLVASPQAYGPESIFVHINDDLAFKFTPVDIQGLGGASLGSGTIDLGDIKGSYNVTSPGQDSYLDTNMSWTDRIYRISITLNGTGKTLKLGFGSNTDEDIDNESMGIDNVRVYQSTGTTTTIQVRGPTQDYVSKGDTQTYYLPGYGPNADAELQEFYDLSVLNTSLITALVDGTPRAFNYATGQNTITFQVTPATDAEIQISVYSDLENNAVGLAQPNPKAFGGVQLSSSMRINIALDKNTDYQPGDVYIVENVGRSTFLLKETLLGASATPDYMLIQRGSSNRNEWSLGNRWFHVSTLSDKLDPEYVANHRATRPIIEFNRNVELYQYGTIRRLDVDMVVEDIEDLNAYLNLTPQSVVLNGVTVATRGANLITLNAVNPTTGTIYGDVESIRILVRNTVNSLLNDKVFVLVNQGNQLKLILETDGDNPSGEAVYGEVVKIQLGTYAGKNLYWDGATWAVAQNKNKVNQAPLFELYDLNGTSLRDASAYPSSTFKGSKLFGYKIDDTGSRVSDEVLGEPLVHDNKGQILFENFLATVPYSYVVGGKFIEITGFYFHNDNNNLSNDWFKSKDNTRQSMLDRYVSDGRTKLFQISQDTNDIQVSIGRVDETKNFAITQLVEDRDFIRVGRQVMIINIQLGDIIEIRTFSTSNPPADATGHYEVPLNLQANADNEEISTLTKGDFYDHFSEIMRKQVGFQGAEYSNNNYRDTARDTTLGTHIIQHSAGLLKTMLLASNSSLDLTAAMRFNESEYSRFKDKFQQKVLDFVVKNTIRGATSYDVWIDAALEELNKGKTKNFAFYLSGMGKGNTGLPTFIPATPSYLGVYSIFQPDITSETIEVEGQEVDTWIVRGHDGSITQIQDPTVAAVYHALEVRIYESIPASNRDRERPLVDWLTVISDQYRTNDYSYDEYQQILRPAFERWVVGQRLDYQTNTSGHANDPWSWNWSSQGIPGHWRAIYQKFYGTQRPDLTPWEALGFTQKPAWWDSRYGGAPYTSENLVLWADLEKGYIFDGDRQGINPVWARPGLTQHIPVDPRGRLRHPGPRDLITRVEADENLHYLGLPSPYFINGGWFWKKNSDNVEHGPFDSSAEATEDFYSTWEYENDEGVLGCGISPVVPLTQYRIGDWAWGDMGPVEQLWQRSSNYAFAVATASYLMKPAAFVELGWNTQDIGLFFKGESNEQFLSQDTKGRPRHSTLQVHGEILEDFSLVTKIGIQQWISDYLASSNTAINTNFADKVRGLGAQLNYKVAGFTDSTTLVTVSDAFGRVPSEDVTVSLYRSPSVREETYSGIAFEWTGRGYEVYGYNALDPFFKIIPGDLAGPKTSVGEDSGKSAVVNWKEAAYYAVNFVVKYGDKFYRAIKSHTAASFFEPQFWVEIARPQYADGTRLTWAIDAALDSQPVNVAYGTVFKTPQDVADFINGYSRYLTSRGWIFDEFSDGDTEIKDWKSALGYFITWSKSTDREVGDYVALSPSSQMIRFKCDQGTIQPIEKIVNGLYAVVDQNGEPIDHRQTRVVRNDGDLTINCDLTTGGIFGLRLYVSELEHVLVFNNKTIFGDTLYSPLLNIKQPRLRVQGFKTVGWKGRIDAPGFIVTGDTLTPNFERAADDFRRFFEIESMENKKLQDRARANFGYEEKEYLNNLLLTPTNQFEFYQGMIQQKGSPTSMRRLLRSNFVRHNKGLKLFEEWAFRVGDYGGQEVTPQLDIQIRQSEFKHNPQLITFEQAPKGTVVGETYGVIKVTDFVDNGQLSSFDSRWHWRPDMPQISWPLRDYGYQDVMPTAGYVNLDEVRFSVANEEVFNTLYHDLLGTENELADRDRIWLYGLGEKNSDGSHNFDAWATYKFNDTGYKMLNVFPATFEGQGAVVQLNNPVKSGPQGSYLSQNTMSNIMDGSNVLSGERLILKGLTGTAIASRSMFYPRYANTCSVTVSGLSSSAIGIMDVYPEAAQTIRSIKVTISETFDAGSVLSLGHETNPEAFLAEGAIDLTVAGTYDVPAAAMLNVSSMGGNRTILGGLFNIGDRGKLTIAVDYFYNQGFELMEINDGQAFPVGSSNASGQADIYTWTKTRFANVDQANALGAIWDAGDIVEVDSFNGLWAVFKWNGGSFDLVRVANRKINSDLLTSAAIFNSAENKLKLILQLYDPAKGYIPGVADRELEFKMVNDPANYDGTQYVWGKEQVGLLWWDQSAVRYLDYEIEDDRNHGINYRWKNWGRVAPGSTVDIYEWVRSPVLPSGWNSYVDSMSNLKEEFKPSGVIVDSQSVSYVANEEWNDELQSDEVVYYFWVLNPTITPATPGRKLSAQQVSSIITNPGANDIPFFAVIGQNQVIIGGIKQFLNENDTVLKLKWTQDAEIINNHHKQWIILREEDERNTINDSLWNKMRDSLVGWDATQMNVPDDRLPKAQQIGALIRPRQSWFPADATLTGQRPSRGAREAWVDIMNNVFADQPFIDQWYDWADVFDTGDTLPSSDRYVTTALDLDELRALQPAARNMVQPGECVLIQNTEAAAGFWTLWKMVEINSVRTFILEDFQKWRMQEGELWNLADWYDNNWSAKNFPNYRFATTAARDAAGNLDVTLLKGTLVQIDHSDTDNRWTWDVYTSTTKYQVAKHNSTIKLSDAFYDNSRVEFGPKQTNAILGTSDATRITPDRIQELANLINYRDGSTEMEFMLNTMKTKLLDTLQKNKIFFSMVKSAFHQSQVVDWAFKTSFLYLGGYSETLRQSPVAFKDQIDNVIAYLEDVKPYHVKIREYVRRLSYGPDLANMAMTDFDKPVYPDGRSNRVLDVNNPADQQIMALNRPWKDWLENYQKPVTDVSEWTPEWNGVRKMNIKVKFDRVSCGSLRGWDTSPWDPPVLVYDQRGGQTYSLSQLSAQYRAGVTDGSPNYYRDQAVETIEDRNYLVRKGIITPDRPGSIVTVLQSKDRYMWTGQAWIKFEAVGWDQDPDMGAASRIQDYRPLPGMARTDDPNIIEGCGFDGTVIDSKFQNGAWDMFEWDSTGWSSEIEQRAGLDMDYISGTTTPADDADPAAIRIDGNQFSQAMVNGDRPRELVYIRGLESLVITVKKSDGVAQKSFMNNLGVWQNTVTQDQGMSFVDWDQTAHTVTVAGPSFSEDAQGYTPLHDPQNPSTGFVRDISLSKGFRGQTASVQAANGTMVLTMKDHKTIPGGLVGINARVALVNPTDPSKRVLGTVTNMKGREGNWNGVVEINVDTGSIDIGQSKSWNIVPADMFNEPGVVWVGNARFTYTSIAQVGDQYILKGAFLSASSLSPLNITDKGIELKNTSPVLDGSKARQKA